MYRHHGLLQAIISLFDRQIPQTRPFSDSSVEQEIKRMYARGDLDRQCYWRLLELAQTGSVHMEDLPTIAKRLQPEESVADIPPTDSLEYEANQLRDKARRAAEAALRATSPAEIEAQLEIQQGALYRLQNIQDQKATSLRE